MTKNAWRWFGLLVVVAMIAGTAAMTVSAQPTSETLKNTAVSAPLEDPSPSRSLHPPSDQKPPVISEEEALRKIAPELRDLAKARSPEIIIVTALMRQGTRWEPYFEKAVARKPLGGLTWVTGEIKGANLIKLAGLPGVLSITSFQSYAPVPAPDDDFRGGIRYRPPSLKLERGQGAKVKEALRRLTAGMTPDQVREQLRSDPQFRARMAEILGRPLPERPALPEKSPLSPQGGIQPTTVKVRDIHGASAAWTKGFTGTGVTVAVVDTGVDFAHPDLQGTQARVVGGPYDGWPYSYDTLSGLFYALGYPTIGPDTYWNWARVTYYAHTLPVENPTCNGVTCTANLKIDFGSDAGWPWPPVVLPFVWPDTSKSGQYYYTVHPDFPLLEAGFLLGLGYAVSDIAPPAVIVADENTAGVYDTVYVDADFDQDLTNNKPMRKGDELAGVDLFDAAGMAGTDGIWDLSAGMLAWIADGTNPPPGMNVLYDNPPIPQAGRLLAFIGDDDSHGTNCAGDIAAQGVITDPEWMGPINPLFAGAGNLGGAGGPVLSGMAPGAKVAAFQHGFWLPFDSWVLAALGFDGIPNSGDEAQISSNSWGASATINDGWDETSRFAHWLARNYAPHLTFLVATGNGGHGYGTVTEPTGGPIIDVGASTSYGTLVYFEFVEPDQFTWGDVQPWSNRGPTTLGDVSPDVVAVGAWGTGANPLNLYPGNGQAAYDIFGGTSMATPVAAGNLALVYQAFKAKHGRWPTWQEAKEILLNGARDLGYDVLTQGSGNVNADRATDIAAGLGGFQVSPAQWQAGDYRGQEYPAFPKILFPGGSDTQVFTVTNPMTTSAVAINLTDAILSKVHEITFTLSFTSFSPSPFTRPTWITDITSLIVTYDPDLVRAQVIFPYSVFDTDGDYSYEDRWRVLFYDWKDLNGDGDLWTDDNGNGWVDAGEIDNSEYNRFTYGYPTGTYLEASVGRDSLSRRHDGVFFGVQRRSGSDPVTLQVRITFYKKTDWSWLTLDQTNLTVPAGGSATFKATLSVPTNARLGVYEGAIYADDGTHTTVIPVVVHVAANSPNFEFGAASLDEPIGDTPYDNGHLFGGFDWTWRYEAGDWKLFYYDLPDGTAGPGRAMIVDTRWVTVPTDVDIWVYGAAPDFYSTSDPAFFGPQSVEQVGGSNNTNIGGGTFTFDTATGGPREVVGGELRDGLGFIALHNVLYAGTQFGEPIVGRAYQVEASPAPVVITTSNVVVPPKTYRDAWVETFTTSYTLTEGIQVLAYGLSQPRTWSGVSLPPGPGVCDWSYDFSVTNGGLIEATAWSTNIADIDLYLYKGSTLIASSTTPTAWEQVRVKRPPDGAYTVCVDNWSGTPGTFNLVLRVIQGTDLVVSGLPTGAVDANTPITFTVTFTKTADPGTTWEGLLFLGPAAAPMAIEIPVTVNIITPTILLSVAKEASAEWASESEVFTYTITVRNAGTDREYATVVDPIPAMVEFVPGSAQASKGTPFLDLKAREMRWQDWVNGGETVTITFQVKAQSGRGWAENTVSVRGAVSAQSLDATARTFINPYKLYLPLVRRESGP